MSAALNHAPYVLFLQLHAVRALVVSTQAEIHFLKLTVTSGPVEQFVRGSTQSVTAEDFFFSFSTSLAHC